MPLDLGFYGTPASAPIAQAAGVTGPAPPSGPVAQAAGPIPGPSAAAPAPAQAGAAAYPPAFEQFWSTMVPLESGGRNIPNYRYDSTHTAGGYGQITDTNWRAYAPKVPGAAQYPNAMAAPFAVQKAVAYQMWKEQGPAPWDRAHGGPLPIGGGSAYEQQKADIRGQEADLNKQMAALSEKIGKLDARDPESLKSLAHYREQMEHYMQQSLQLATNPPQFHPGQQMQQQGGMAMIIGMLAGALTKRPLIASLNAGAAALNAYNKGDHEAYQRELDKWKTSTDAMFKMAEFEHQMYEDTLKDEKLSESEKLDKIAAQASLLGNQRMLLASQSANLDQVQQNQRSYDAMMLHYLAKTQGVGAGFGKAGEYEITTPDGKTQRLSLTQGKQPGQWADAATGQPMTFPPGTQIQQLSAGAGRQEATQINAMVGSTNEAVGDLNNLMELPSRATAGLFMGVQTESPSDLAEAVRRSFASYMTEAESKDLLVSAQGIQRELATIEAQGRATGLVGLTKMADTLIPQAGDPGPVVLRKYAQIRQIIERNIETIISRTNVDQKQKELLERNREEIKKAVPFSVHDVNELERRLDSGDDMSVAEYAKKAFGAGGGSQLAMPKVGDVQEGYRFKGGDPADPNNWEKQ